MSTPTTDKHGNKWYYNEHGLLHCPDGPAVERANGTKEWWVNGRLHRTDGPAIEWADGDKEWWVNNQRHRTDGPAIEWAGGDKEWYLNGQRHRTDGPAWEWADGDKEWWVNGQLLTEEEFNVKYGQQQQPTIDKHGNKRYYNEQGQRHRTDGPAWEGADGSKAWWVNGQRHRTDGPAIEWADGYKSWWVNGRFMTEAEFNAQYGQHQPSLDGSIITINGITYKLVKQ
jgi:hypothetical protein